MHKKALAAIVTIGLVLTTSVQVFADPSVDSQLNTYQSKYNQSQSDLSAAEKKYDDLNNQVQALDEKISDNMTDIDKVNSQMNSVQTNINETQKSISKAENDIRDQQENYNEMMKSMYTNDSSAGYVNVLLDSKGLSDFIEKVSIIQKINEYDSQIISNLDERKSEVEAKKQALADDQTRLSNLKDQSEKKLADLNSQKASITPLVAQAQTEKNAAMASSATFKAQVTALNEKSQQMKAQALAVASQTPSVNRGGSYTGGNSVISFASQYIGLMYLYGGTSPSTGFDCSGFVQYVYAHFGVSLGRTTYAQIDDGTPVTGGLQAGDLVFFGNPSAPEHVGIYIGNGQMIDSPRTGEAIGIHNLYSNYSAARRVR